MEGLTLRAPRTTDNSTGWINQLAEINALAGQAMERAAWALLRIWCSPSKSSPTTKNQHA